jgi:uncharacterized protein YyaL (SSP411 family)
LLDHINGLFRVSNDTALLAEQITPSARRPPPRVTASCWPSAVHVSALAEAVRADRGRADALKQFVEATDAYWVGSGGGSRLGGYNAFAGTPAASAAPDRYFDDNAWMCLALLDAHEATRDPDYLSRARRALEFALSGTDASAGGGIYQSERERTGKYACSTAPTIVACLRMDAITGRFEFRAPAAVLYRWINEHLQDTDGLYFDHVTLGGQVDRAKFSYNTAMMIQANCLWSDSTGNPWFLEEAQRLAAAASAFWLDGATGGVHDDGALAHLLIGALIELHARDADPRWLGLAQRCSAFLAWRHADPNGWHPRRWDVVATEPLAQVRLIDQSCVARTILRTARYAQ